MSKPQIYIKAISPAVCYIFTIITFCNYSLSKKLGIDLWLATNSSYF